MAEVLNNIEELVDKNEKLIDIWGRRNPKFEIKYEKTVMRAISDYGVGASRILVQEAKCLVLDMSLISWRFLSVCMQVRNCHYQKKQRSWDRTWSFGVLLKHEKGAKLILRCVLIYLWLLWQRQT